MAGSKKTKLSGIESVCREVLMLYGIVLTRGQEEDRGERIAAVVWARWLSANRDELMNRTQNEYKLERLFQVEDRRWENEQELIFETFSDVLYIQMGVDERDMKAYMVALKMFFDETEKRGCGLKDAYKGFVKKVKIEAKERKKAKGSFGKGEL